ncbi:SGNH/GDSL hydrolase family protein [Treponema sp.]
MMKTILCYGDSNTWGANPSGASRFGPHIRWPGVLRDELNQYATASERDYWVVEEGLCGRTTCREDPVEGDKNGLRQLIPILDSHKPLDLVIVMLGTNDLKVRFNPTAWDIAQGAQLVGKSVLSSATGEGDTAPKLLLIAPPPTAKLTYFRPMFGSCKEISEAMAARYRQFATEIGAEFLDAGSIIVSSDLDGIHLEASEHRKLGLAVAAKVKEILDSPK